MHCEQAARRFFLMFVLLEGACACITASRSESKRGVFTDCGETGFPLGIKARERTLQDVIGLSHLH
jgi:hypothetical protein